MNQKENPIEILKRLRAVRDLVVIADVKLQTNVVTGEKFTSIKVQTLSSLPVVTSGGRTVFMRPFAWTTDSAENFNNYEIGDYAEGRIMKVQAKPYSFEVTDRNGQIKEITLDHTWQFLPPGYEDQVQVYVPNKFRQQVPVSADDKSLETEVFDTESAGF